MIQNRTVGDTLSSFLMESASSHPDNFSVAAEATFTCASFFTEGVVGIHCEATHSFSDGRCTRSERTTPSSLCAADKPVDMLLLAWDEDQKRGTVRISSDERQKVTEWLNHFLPDMCGALGHATVVLSAISTAGSGMVILLLLFGVIFDTLESRVVHGGAITTLIAASVQAALIGVWIFETLILHHEGNHFGTAFYAAIASIVVHAITFVVAMRHLRIEKDALVELGLLEDDDESIDDIFKTKKLADDWDDGDTVVTASSPRMSPRISPRKEDSSRQVEVVV
ncbi:Transmembrane protein [Phytophthora megakarya]|uniref:Transmembrane protein n=1 Tax=Phytophthora megakarya TaxID=4795 RepID=A0A225V0C4_9STRA|nr:Transmembrane protein [Phytophthora megakarya]